MATLLSDIITVIRAKHVMIELFIHVLRQCLQTYMFYCKLLIEYIHHTVFSGRELYTELKLSENSKTAF